MTSTSLSPMAAGAVGISFADLAERLLRSARLHVALPDQQFALKPGGTP